MANDLVVHDGGQLPQKSNQLALGASNPLLNMGGAWEALGPVFNFYGIQYEETPERKRGLVNVTDGQAQTVRCALLAILRGRQHWVKVDGGGGSKDWQYLACSASSAELTHPDGGEKPQPGPCGSCPLSQWERKQGQGEDVPPACTEVYSLTLFDLDRKAPFLFRFKRRATNTVIDLKRQLTLGALRWGLPGLPTNCCVELSLSVEPYKTYYVPRLQIVRKLEQTQAQWLWRYSQAISGQVMEVARHTDNVASPPQEAVAEAPEEDNIEHWPAEGEAREPEDNDDTTGLEPPEESGQPPRDEPPF